MESSFSQQWLVVKTEDFNSRDVARVSYPINEAAERAGVPRKTWLRYWRWGLANDRGVIDPQQYYFDEEAIYRVRRAEHIRRRMETDLRAAATIVKLMERVEHLKRELDFYR